jgi:hypothetical protein
MSHTARTTSIVRVPHIPLPTTRDAPARHGRPRATPRGEVNERYRQHPATGSFAVQTEGEITRWDTFAAQRSSSLRHTGRRFLRHTGRGGSTRKGSRNEVAAPPRRRTRAVAERRVDGGKEGTEGTEGR